MPSLQELIDLVRRNNMPLPGRTFSPIAANPEDEDIRAQYAKAIMPTGAQIVNVPFPEVGGVMPRPTPLLGKVEGSAMGAAPFASMLAPFFGEAVTIPEAGRRIPPVSTMRPPADAPSLPSLPTPPGSPPPFTPPGSGSLPNVPGPGGPGGGGAPGGGGPITLPIRPVVPPAPPAPPAPPVTPTPAPVRPSPAPVPVTPVRPIVPPSPPTPPASAAPVIAPVGKPGTVRPVVSEPPRAMPPSGGGASTIQQALDQARASTAFTSRPATSTTSATSATSSAPTEGGGSARSMSIPVAPARPTIMINVDPSRMMSGRDWEEGMQRYAQTPQGGTNPYAAQAALLRYALTPRGEESNEIGGEGGKSLFERIMELGKTGEERQRKLVEFFRNEEPGGGRVYGG